MYSFYAGDLAYIHHTGFSDFALGAAPGLLALLREAGVTSGKVADLGCGSGLWLRELIRAGYEAVGVDISSAFLALARKTAPRAELHQASLHAFDLPACAAVTALGESLGYLPDSAGAEPDIKNTFERIYEALQPGGLLVFDLIVAVPKERMSGRTWRTGEDWAVLSELEEDLERGLLTRRIVTFRRKGGAYRRGEETHVQRVYGSDEVQGMLQEVGFEVSSSDSYGTFTLLPRRMAFTAQKLDG